MIKSRRDVVETNHYSGCNCAQSVFTAYYDLFLPGVEKETAMKLALSFGGGLARTQGVCGAACGSAMLLGLKYGPVQMPTSDEIWDYHGIVRKFLQDFKDINESIYCSDIVRCDISTPEAYEKAHSNMENYCTKAIMSASDLLEEKYSILEL